MLVHPNKLVLNIYWKAKNFFLNIIFTLAQKCIP